jgi:hypothetical protein
MDTVKAGKATIEVMAAVSGIPPATFVRAAYLLRTAGGDLFPTGGPGGGTKAPRARIRHLNNLVLAGYATNPLNEAPELVPRYRSLVSAPTSRLLMFGMWGPDPEDWDRAEREISAILDHLCPGVTLGDRLDGLVRHLMTTDDRDFARHHLTSLSVWRYRFPGGAIGASLDTRFGVRSFQEPVIGLLPPMEEGVKDPRVPAAAARDMVVIPFAMFETLADLMRDGAPGHKSSSDAAGGTAGADIETATPATGGTGPASVDDIAGQPGCSPVNPDDVTSHQDSGKKKRRQRSASSAPPGSPSSDPPNQPKDEPPWPKSNLPMRSAG